MAARARRLALAAAAACLLAPAPADAVNPLAALTGVSVEQEREIGWDFDRQIRAVIPIVDDPIVTEFVDDVGQSLVRELGAQPFAYRFRVVAHRELNAFAVPGGYVYLHTGTILGAGSLSELAGVLAHEVGHVKGHHYARMREQTALPELLTTLAGVAAAAATGEPGVAIAALGANVALQLRFTREFEAEADELATTFVTRAGYDPHGIVRFFERIVALDRPDEIRIPPYLYSHPDVTERIAVVTAAADALPPAPPPSPELEERFHTVQARLAVLVDSERTTLPGAVPTSTPATREESDALRSRAEARLREGDREAALALFAEAERIDPADPRAPFRRGEILEEAGRRTEAIDAFRRVLRLDPSGAALHFRLGQAYKALHDELRALFHFEQAAWRFTPNSAPALRADWERVKLVFPIVVESGFADGEPSRAADTPFGLSRDAFGPDARRVVWWGRVAPRFEAFARGLRVRHTDSRGVVVKEQTYPVRVRWSDPSGRVVHEGAVERPARGLFAATLELPVPRTAGAWTAELVLDGDVVDARGFRVAP
jgi:predicted Zn-dependent protease